jgi:hypothetical protein
MSKEQLIGRLLAATPGELRKIELVFSGITESVNTDNCRLLSLMDAAQATNVIRTTVLLSARNKGAVWQFVFRFKSALAVRHTVMVAYPFLVWRLILAILTCFLR